MSHRSVRLRPSLLALCAASGFSNCVCAIPEGAGHDRGTLLAQLAISRAHLSEVSVAVTVERAEAHPIPVQRDLFSWGPQGVRWEVVVEAAQPEGWVDRTVSVFDAATASGVEFDGVQYARVGSPPEFNVSGWLPEYLCLLGYFPSRDLAGVPVMNDAATLLADPNTMIVPGTTTVRGHECIIVELRSPGADPLSPPRMRGAHASSLGLAQVELQSFNLDADGAIVRTVTWRTDEFLAVADGAAALPLSGRFTIVLGDGTVEADHAIVVDTGSDGEPAVVLGVAPVLAVDLPAGTTVHDVTTGETWILAAASPGLAPEPLRQAVRNARPVEEADPFVRAAHGDVRWMVGVGLLGALALGASLAALRFGPRRRSGSLRSVIGSA
ncbi:MAG TPA: hypothetical protein PKC43_04130 [Phycisphaerales bacterium]|nr:hypothetical protein [Phycisphaerales bacterium]HMP36615.1 hypothetical protein [Phycisphaerales bacterium]